MTSLTDQLREMIANSEISKEDLKIEVLDDVGDEPVMELDGDTLKINHAAGRALQAGADIEHMQRPSVELTIEAPPQIGNAFHIPTRSKRKKGGNKEWWLRR